MKVQLCGRESKCGFRSYEKLCIEDAMLYYPSFDEEFEIHTDSINYQIGAIISQKGRLVVYWSKIFRKCN